MVSEQQSNEISEDEVNSFASKLDAWATELSPIEQSLLQRLLTHAAEADVDDTKGHIIVVGGISDRSIIIVSGRQASPFFRQSLGFQPFAGSSGLSAFR